MKDKVYNFELTLDWDLLSLISKIDRFDASWTTIEKREGQSLQHLRTMATIRSVGASTRIEGSKMSDEQVKVFLEKLEITNLEDRDRQEVAGYYGVLDVVIEDYKGMVISENTVKGLHNLLMRYSQKDEWHKGDYKQHTNAVEASFPDGSRQIIFQTTAPGYATEDAMRSLMNWYREEVKVHPLIKVAALVYEFLSIHPFQDGNGRLSRLLTTLSLLRQGYSWVQYVSFEHEIENSKKSYYQKLRHCQAQRPNEDISEWVNYFLTSLLNIQTKLSLKLAGADVESKMAPREKSIYIYIGENPGCKSGEIAEHLGIPNPTVKRILSALVKKDVIEKFGRGAGINYTLK
jgi:Fic family protein